MNKKDQESKKVIDVLRNAIRDFVLTVTDLKKSSSETYNVLKKIYFVNRMIDLNKLALLDISILKEEYLKEKNNLNLLASHVLLENDYNSFINIFEVSNVRETVNSLDNIIGVKLFLKKLNNQEMASFINKIGTTEIKSLSLKLVKLGQVKNLRDIDLSLIHDLLLKTGVKNQNKDGTPGVDDIQFKEILLKSFELLKGHVNDESLQSFVKAYKNYEISLTNKEIPVFENSEKDILIANIKKQISKWNAEFGVWKIKIEEFSFLKQVLQNLKKYDTEHNYNVIMEHKDNLNKILYFVEDQKVYDSFLRLTSEPRLLKSPWTYSPEKQSEALNNFLDVASLMDNFTSTMKINNDIVSIAKVDVPLCERAAFFAMYLENNKEKKAVDSDDMKIFLKQAEKLTKKTNFPYESLVEIDDYLNLKTVSSFINYEGFEMPKNKTCLEALKVVDGKLEKFIVNNTSSLKSDNKELIAKKIKELKNIKDRINCFVALDGEDLIIIPVQSKKISTIKFESKNMDFNSQKDFCDIDILNEVFATSIKTKEKHLERPSLIYYQGNIGFLKDIEIIGDKIQLSIIELNIENVRGNPCKSFPIIKKYINSEKEMKDVVPANEVQTLLFMQNMMFAKNNISNDVKRGNKNSYK